MQAKSILLFLLLFGLGFAAHFIYRMIMEKNEIRKSQDQARIIIEGVEKKAEEIRNRAESRAKKLVKDKIPRCRKCRAKNAGNFPQLRRNLKPRKVTSPRNTRRLIKKSQSLERYGQNS